MSLNRGKPTLFPPDSFVDPPELHWHNVARNIHTPLEGTPRIRPDQQYPLGPSSAYNRCAL